MIVYLTMDNDLFYNSGLSDNGLFDNELFDKCISDKLKSMSSKRLKEFCKSNKKSISMSLACVRKIECFTTHYDTQKPHSPQPQHLSQ